MNKTINFWDRSLSTVTQEMEEFLQDVEYINHSSHFDGDGHCIVLVYKQKEEN